MSTPRRSKPSVDELGRLPLFATLEEQQLEWLCASGAARAIEPGWVYQLGQRAESLFVLLEGEVEVGRGTDDRPATMVRTTEPGTYGGAVQAYVGAPHLQSYSDSMRAVARSRFFILPAEAFSYFLDRWFPMAVLLMRDKVHRDVDHPVTGDGREQLHSLGSLAAGLTHELNNPAAAAVRATALLRNRVWRSQEKLADLAEGRYTGDELGALLRVQEDALRRTAQAPRLSPIEASDMQDALVGWFEAHELSDGWDLAPTFVQGVIGIDLFDGLLQKVGTQQLEDAVRWLNYAVETELLMREIEESTRRISALVTAAKQYSQTDRAPSELVDVHDLLDATLPIFADRLGGIDVIRRYARQLPRIPAFAGELNQVWTNLVDNALDAMGEHGTLTVTTEAGPDVVTVTIADTGPGVPTDLQGRVFDPFFSTKPFGEGTGLGLDVVHRIVRNRHHGAVRLFSQPGDTRFVVTLPLAREHGGAT